MKNKKQKILLAFMAVAFLVGAGFVSYAFLYDLNLVGQRTNAINTCSFKIAFKDKNPLRLLKEVPINGEDLSQYEPYTFYVEANESNCERIEYTVSLQDVCTTCELVNGICTIEEGVTCNCNAGYKIDEEYLSYSLLKKGEEFPVTGTNIINLNQQYVLENGKKDEFELKMWINEDATAENLYVYNNSEPLFNQDGTNVTKNYCTRINIETSLATNNDMIAPTVTSAEIISPETGTYGIDQEYQINITFSEETTGVAPTLTIRFGDGTTRAISNPIKTNNVYSYYSSIVAGDNGVLTLVSLGGGTLKDLSENEADLTLPTQSGTTVTALTAGPTCTLLAYNNYPKYIPCAKTTNNVGSGTTSNNGVTLTVSSSSANLAAEPYSWDGGATWTSNTTINNNRSASKNYVVYVRDSLGNIGSCEKRINKYIRYSIVSNNYSCSDSAYTLSGTTSNRTCTYITYSANSCPSTYGTGNLTNSTFAYYSGGSPYYACTYNITPTVSTTLVTQAEVNAATGASNSQIRMYTHLSNNKCGINEGGTITYITMPDSTLSKSYSCIHQTSLGCGYDWAG